MMHSMIRSRTLPWVILFLILSVVGIQLGGTNAVSRIAGLRALTEGGTLNIDHYHDWSFDWSLAPNGHYYPNKAPGAVLFGLPVFALLDFPARWIDTSPHDSFGRAAPPGYLEVTLLNLIMQLLPYALLVLYLCGALEKEIGSPFALHLFALAALFGNTAALYMGAYFGHGLAALLMLGSFAAWLRGRYGIAGALIAASLLSDYGTACVIPCFLLATAQRERSVKPLKSVFLGALPFALLWIWYHQAAFGSPFTLAIKYSNPSQLETVEGSGVWGLLSALPSFAIVQKLLFGPERGILFTQPWVLAVIPLLFVRTRLPRGTTVFLSGGLLALLWMNASVIAWHGGMALGPRYLCLLFPSIALALFSAWKDLSAPWHILLSLGVILSVAFRVLVFPFSILAPLENLWGYHLHLYAIADWPSSTFNDLLIAIGGFVLASLWVWLIEKRLAKR